ncbi:hypothetical protein Tco_1067148 [Tanacetum coccineum]|uniref:Reverse transcriptase domain-containing protein n=1 Tax=Tanacetum coccineum TaxID=301880 RepID=A0ABQ5HC29_9ASTR
MGHYSIHLRADCVAPATGNRTTTWDYLLQPTSSPTYVTLSEYHFQVKRMLNDCQVHSRSSDDDSFVGDCILGVYLCYVLDHLDMYHSDSEELICNKFRPCDVTRLVLAQVPYLFSEDAITLCSNQFPIDLEPHRTLSKIHSTFHVSNLKKCLSNEALVIPLDEIQIDDKFHFIEEPVESIDREVKHLKQSRILSLKSDGTQRENLSSHGKVKITIDLAIKVMFDDCGDGIRLVMSMVYVVGINSG